MSRRFNAAELCAAASFAGLASFAGYRAHLVDATFGRYSGCGTCLEPAVWANDAFLFAGFVALVAMSRLTANRLCRAVFAGLAAGFVLAYCVDILVFRLLTHRLLASDVLHFAADAPILSSVARPLLSQPEGWVLLLGAAITGFAAAAAIALGRASLRRAAQWGVLAGAVLMFAMSVTQAEYIHDYAFKNLLQVNLETDPGRPYSAAAWKHAASASGLATQCEAGLSQRPSVIVLVVESLSTYHSHLLSGLHDDTPNLDRLAQAASYFPDFRANGYSTEGGLIALLTGRAPIPTAGRLGSAMAFVDVEGDFHRRLREHGYRSLFFTSGRLDFGERDRWLAAIGIEYAEGADHPFYAGMARGPFDAASDGALFDRFLQWHARAGAQPFMATILTVSTHPPYVGADGRPDEAQRFREVDRQIARFAGALEARGFFRGGVMVIVGDHRAMTPISDVEQRRLGDAEVRVPALILGSSGLARGAIAGNMQQTDLIPSLAHLMFERSCRNEWQGRFLGENPQPARYVVHADPMRRNHVIAIEGNARYTLALDGDDTHWRTAPPRPQDADRLREEVNRERMARMAEFRASP